MGGGGGLYIKVVGGSLSITSKPGPATLLSKVYASLFQKTLRKCLFLCFVYVLDFREKKGPFFKECQQF